MVKSIFDRSFEIYITEDKFDSMSEAQKLQFKYCPECGRFYNTDYLENCRCKLIKRKYNSVQEEVEELELRVRVIEGEV